MRLSRVLLVVMSITATMLCIDQVGAKHNVYAQSTAKAQAIVNATGCTTSTAYASVCYATVAWPAAFADANYAATCTGNYTAGGSSAGQGAFLFINSLSAGSLVIKVTNTLTTGYALTLASLSCTGIHN